MSAWVWFSSQRHWGDRFARRGGSNVDNDASQEIDLSGQISGLRTRFRQILLHDFPHRFEPLGILGKIGADDREKMRHEVVELEEAYLNLCHFPLMLEFEQAHFDGMGRLGIANEALIKSDDLVWCGRSGFRVTHGAHLVEELSGPAI
nr:hypothetical protein [Asaia sp. SF2.1]